MINKAYESIPNPDFSPKGRALEYALVREAKKAIIESKEFSEKEKRIAIKDWEDYLLDYDRLYIKKLEEDHIKGIENNLKETDLLKKDNETILSWKKLCIRKDFKRREGLN
jgi:hypothetical protein